MRPGTGVSCTLSRSKVFSHRLFTSTSAMNQRVWAGHLLGGSGGQGKPSPYEQVARTTAFVVRVSSPARTVTLIKPSTSLKNRRPQIRRSAVRVICFRARGKCRWVIRLGAEELSATFHRLSVSTFGKGKASTSDPSPPLVPQGPSPLGEGNVVAAAPRDREDSSLSRPGGRGNGGEGGRAAPRLTPWATVFRPLCGLTS